MGKRTMENSWHPDITSEKKKDTSGSNSLIPDPEAQHSFRNILIKYKFSVQILHSLSWEKAYNSDDLCFGKQEPHAI